MKRFLTFAAFAAVALSSCSKEGVIDEANGSNGGGGALAQDERKVSFGATTSRANSNDLSTVALKGFQVFATEGASPTEWYNDVDGTATDIDGTNNYINKLPGGNYDALAWYWTSDDGTTELEAPYWPDADVFTMNFYAIYPEKTFASADPTDVANSLKTDHTVSVDRFSQVDELSAVVKGITSVPSGGRLSLEFQHIMTQVNVSALAATGYEIGVQGITFHNIESNGTYNYSTEYNGANTEADVTARAGWASAGTPATEDYEYLDSKFVGSVNGDAGQVTLGGTAYNVKYTFREGTGSIAVADMAQPAYTAKYTGTGDVPLSEGSFMFIPQSGYKGIEVNDDYSLKADVEIKIGDTTPPTPDANQNVYNEQEGTFKIANDVPYLEVYYCLTNGSEQLVGRSNILNVNPTNLLYYKDPSTNETNVISSLEALYNSDGTEDTNYEYYGHRLTSGAGAAEGLGLDDDYIPSGYAQTDDKLFVKAYFPLKLVDDAGVVLGGIADLKRGVSYNFQLNLDVENGNGGYFADNQYYDQSGNPLGLYHAGTPGDPIISRQRIHFNVSVNEWLDTTTTLFPNDVVPAP